MRTWSERTPKPCGAACDVGTTRRADGNPRMEGHPSGTGSLRRQEADRVGKAASAGLEEESLKDPALGHRLEAKCSGSAWCRALFFWT